MQGDMNIPGGRGRAKVAKKDGWYALLGKLLVDGHLVEAVPYLVDLGIIRIHFHNGRDKLVVVGCTFAARFGPRRGSRGLARDSEGAWGSRSRQH